jgi:hypothetical protein
MLYYLDIESGGVNPDIDEIVTIQYQPIDSTGQAIGGLIILKSWESSERDIVEKFHKLFITDCVWDFTALGVNLIFDLTFLLKKFEKYGLPIGKEPLDFLFFKPFLDLKSNLVIINDLRFKNSGLDKLTNKESDGRMIPEYFKAKEYDKIVKYIEQETKSFLEALQVIIIHDKELKVKLKRDCLGN